MQILTRLKKLEKSVSPKNQQAIVAQRNASDAVGGINVSLLPAKDAYAYAYPTWYFVQQRRTK